MPTGSDNNISRSSNFLKYEATLMKNCLFYQWLAHSKGGSPEALSLMKTNATTAARPKTVLIRWPVSIFFGTGLTFIRG
jgi:hypothetical protein